jgi:hypothetical protein
MTATKCDKTQPELSSSYVYEQTYGINQEAQSIHDLYTLLHNYSQDSIPLSKWPAFMGKNDEGFILQQMLTKRSDSINYIFIYNIHKVVDSTFYDIKVRKIILAK